MIENPLLLELPLPIKTPRLLIYAAHPQFAEPFWQAKQESADILVPWMTWADKVTTLDDEKEFLIRAHAEFILRQTLMMLAFTHDGQFVVSTGFHDIHWKKRMADIGYWCKKSAHGKGYVTEASNALLRYGFGPMRMQKISIAMDAENSASERVVQRLNMAKEYERTGGISTLHEGDGLRIERSYCCFNAHELPPLDVTW